MKEVSARHGCDDCFTFGHEVTKAIWDDIEGKWRLTVMANGTQFDDYCHILINAAGILK